MCEFVSGHFYLPMWTGPTVKNTFYSTKTLAVSDRIGFKKSKAVYNWVTNFVNFDKYYFGMRSLPHFLGGEGGRNEAHLCWPCSRSKKLRGECTKSGAEIMTSQDGCRCEL